LVLGVIPFATEHLLKATVELVQPLEKLHVPLFELCAAVRVVGASPCGQFRSSRPLNLTGEICLRLGTVVPSAERWHQIKLGRPQTLPAILAGARGCNGYAGQTSCSRTLPTSLDALLFVIPGQKVDETREERHFKAIRGLDVLGDRWYFSGSQIAHWGNKAFSTTMGV